MDSVLYLLISTAYDHSFHTPLILAWCAQASELFTFNQKFRYQIPILIFSKASRQ